MGKAAGEAPLAGERFLDAIDVCGAVVTHVWLGRNP